MIKFITNRTDHEVTVPRATIEECIEYLDTLKEIGIDTENSSLVPHHSVPLLLQVGDNNKTFVIDTTCIDPNFLKKYEDKPIIGQNLKYDYQIMKVHWGLEFRNLIDLMIIEQTLGRGSGRRNSLDAIIERRLNTKATYEKSTRNEFINASKSFIFSDRHIIYAGDDIQYLHPIYEVQKPIIERLGMGFLLYDIELPLIPILADGELEGLRFNVPKWKENMVKNKKEQYRLQLLLDEEVKKLANGDAIYESNDKLKGGKFTRKRNAPVEIIQTCVFGDDKIVKQAPKANINYGSTDQVKNIFVRAEEMLPTDNTGKETIGVEHLKRYIVDYSDSRLYNFIEYLIKFSAVTERLNSFGQKHIDIISPKTGKIHTIYRQCTATTGRFQSGGKRDKLPFYNSQQIPKENDYRHCFHVDEDYEMLTIDLSSAELIILGSLANDMKLLELQASDIHGYLASASYNKLMEEIRKAVLVGKSGIMDHHIKSVEDLLSGTKSTEKVSFEEAKLILENFMEGEAVVINKKKFEWLRDNFKRVVYGLAYGATASKIAEVLGISKHWAQIVLNTIRSIIPATFKYLDEVGRLAVTKGYTLLSTRTKARRWFSDVLLTKENGIELPFNKKGDIEREAKNAGIQGTNAFIIKEAMVRIANEYIRPNKIDAEFLLQVHDELVYKYHKSLKDTFPQEVHRLLTDTAKRYLVEGVEMGAAYHTGLTWHK